MISGLKYFIAPSIISTTIPTILLFDLLYLLYLISMISNPQLFKNLFISTNPPAHLVKGGELEDIGVVKSNKEYFYMWSIAFNGNTSDEVYIIENYRPLAIMIIFPPHLQC